MAGDGDEERAFLVFNRMVNAIKEKTPLDTVYKVSVELPEGYPAARLKGYFSQLGIILSTSVSPTGEIKVREVLLK
jgi:hypothetical protein